MRRELESRRRQWASQRMVNCGVQWERLRSFDFAKLLASNLNKTSPKFGPTNFQSKSFSAENLKKFSAEIFSGRKKFGRKLFRLKKLFD